MAAPSARQHLRARGTCTDRQPDGGSAADVGQVARDLGEIAHRSTAGRLANRATRMSRCIPHRQAIVAENAMPDLGIP